MKVLALDPGYDRLGLAVLQNNDQIINLLYSTCLTSDKTKTSALRLLEIGRQYEDLLKYHQPDGVAIEGLFFNKNVKTALGVAEARGIIIYLTALTNCPIYEYNPSTIKLATTGYGKSDKTAVFSMIKKLVQNVPEEALDDEYDAIAVGVTCLAEVGRGR